MHMYYVCTYTYVCVHVHICMYMYAEYSLQKELREKLLQMDGVYLSQLLLLQALKSTYV